jgi:hypothetical protein
MRLDVLLRVACPAVLVLSLAACGEDAPGDASVNDFCAAIAPLGRPGDEAKEYDQIGKVGTPDDMPDDARHGLQYLLDQADDDDYLQFRSPAVEDGLDGDDLSNYRALEEYVFHSCIAIDLPSQSPS